MTHAATGRSRSSGNARSSQAGFADLAQTPAGGTGTDEGVVLLVVVGPHGSGHNGCVGASTRDGDDTRGGCSEASIFRAMSSVQLCFLVVAAVVTLVAVWCHCFFAWWTHTLAHATSRSPSAIQW